MNPAIDAYVQQIRAAYPDLDINQAQLNASGGQFSDVLIVNQTLIFRFPKSLHVAAELYREIPVLRTLQGKLPLPIPNVIYQSQAAQPDHLAFMGYPMIPGRPLLRDVFAAINDESILERIAAQLAGFLKALHGLQPQSLGLDVAPPDNRAQWLRMHADFRENLFPHMRPDARQQVDANFDAALDDPALWDFQPVLCHGDFGTGNILYANSHVTGIIDFSFCAPGDPAQEVGALLSSYGEDFIERVFRFYPTLRPAVPRARFIKSNYALMQALSALRDHNQEDFDDGMRSYI